MPMLPDARVPLLLDTHVWIWLMEGAEKELGKRTCAELQRGSSEGKLLVSVISVWEVVLLHAKGRIRFSLDLDEWVQRALHGPGISMADLILKIVIDSAQLLGTVQGDPADRILIATARGTGACVAMRDEKIISYGARGFLSVLDAAS